MYTPPEIEWLTGIPAARALKWIRDEYGHGPRRMRAKAPLLISDHPDARRAGFATFRDLHEMRMIEWLRIQCAWSMPKIRRMIQGARHETGLDHPLCSGELKTDRAGLYIDNELREVDGGQLVFPSIVRPFLETLTIHDHRVVRWQAADQVIVDPRFSRGQPVLSQHFVPTRALALAAEGQGISAAASMYGLPESAVKVAVEFEAVPPGRVSAA